MADHPYANANYKHMLGCDPMGDLVDSDPFKGKPPTDPRDYKIYRSHYENGFYRIMRGLPPNDNPMQQEEDGGAVLKVSASCEWMGDDGYPVVFRRVKKEHIGNPVMWCCDHVIFADPENPEGVLTVPFEKDRLLCYFLCKTCFKLMEQCRLRFVDVIKPKCGLCVKEAIDKLIAKHPDRFRDLRFVDGALPYQL